MTNSALRRLIWGIVASLAASFAATTAFGFATPRLKPPAPGPEYLTRADYALLSEASRALKRKRFDEALASSAQIEDPIAKSLAAWIYYMAEDPAVDVSEADAFLDVHDDWPLIARIQDFVEDKIPDDAPADEVLAFFDMRRPVSGEGKIALARALLATGEEAAGEFHLRDAWINHNFTIAKERRILSLYGDRLRPQDHAARVDRLLWDRQVTNARRVMPYLDARDRAKATARAALILRAADGPRLYEKLPEEDRSDPALLQAAVRYYRRTHHEETAIALSNAAPDDPQDLGDPARWWDERQLLMRWALGEGRFADAYQLAAHNGLAEGADFAEAEFDAGWIALRFLGEAERAEAHFLALASAVTAPISLSRAFYWAGRAASDYGDAAQAQRYFEKASAHYYSFYGQLAAEALGGDAAQRRFGPSERASPEDQALFGSRPTVAALRMLADLDLDYEFMVFAYHVDDQLERPGEYAELAKLVNGERAPHLGVRAGKVAVNRNAFAADVAYPLIYLPEEAQRFVAPEIILGLSRQESEFNPRAFSRAGARGVMQLIPATALITARKEGIRYSRERLLDDPDYNITLGSAHFSHLLERFDGSLILSLAAYNAGVNRANQWIVAYGDPREGDVDPLDWIELVPFTETRNYIQRVLENIQVYRGRLNNEPIPGRLASDLERGGADRRVAQTPNGSGKLAALAALREAQPLAPLPYRTRARAETFKIAMAAAEAADASSLSAEAAPANPSPGAGPARANVRNRAVRGGAKRRRGPAPAASGTMPDAAAPEAVNPVLAEEPAPSAEEDQPADHEGGGAAEPKPIVMRGEGASPPAFAGAAPDAAAGATREGPDFEAAASALLDAAKPAAPAAPLGDEEVQGPSYGDGARIAAIHAAGESAEAAPAMDECLTYREFLARNAEDEAVAADLNAGMLAEFRSGNGACD